MTSTIVSLLDGTCAKKLPAERCSCLCLFKFHRVYCVTNLSHAGKLRRKSSIDEPEDLRRSKSKSK